MHVLGYFLSIVCAAFVAPLFGLLFSTLSIPFVRPFRPLGRIRGALHNLVMATISMGAAMAGFLWVLKQLGVAPAFLMFLIPLLGVAMNDFRRIDAAKKHRWLSGLGQFMSRHTDGIDYEGVLWSEYASLVGDMIGIGFPVAIAFKGMSLW